MGRNKRLVGRLEIAKHFLKTERRGKRGEERNEGFGGFFVVRQNKNTSREKRTVKNEKTKRHQSTGVTALSR